MQNKSISWFWVFVAFIVFWPFGLILFFVKLSSDKSATMNSGNGLYVVSIIMLIIGILILYVSSTNDMVGNSGYAAGCLVLVGAICANRTARRAKRNGKCYKKYIELIVNQGQTSIDVIAVSAKVPYQTVLTDLLKMIQLGYFSGAHIDYAYRRIVLARPDFATPLPNPVYQTPIAQFNNNAAVAASAIAPPVPPQISLISCSSCGANNRVVAGRLADCEYCGSPLQ